MLPASGWRILGLPLAWTCSQFFMALLISYVLLALVVSFLCSVLEATLLTVSPVSIETARQSGARWAERMERLKSDIDRPLSAILTLNTIAHTMGAAGAGAEYARLYGNAYEAVFAGVLTFAILVVTEIIPKTLGARFAMQLAGPVSWSAAVVDPHVGSIGMVQSSDDAADHLWQGGRSAAASGRVAGGGETWREIG